MEDEFLRANQSHKTPKNEKKKKKTQERHQLHQKCKKIQNKHKPKLNVEWRCGKVVLVLKWLKCQEGGGGV